MRSVTLSHSLLHCPKLPQPSFLSPFNLNSSCSLSRKSFSSSRFGYPWLIFSRCSGQWREDKAQLGICKAKPTIDETEHAPYQKESRSLYFKDRSLNTESKDGLSYQSSLVESPITPNSRTKSRRFLMPMALLGMLAFQGMEPAIAASDITAGLQSIPYLGDLGDISTGFASAFLLIFFSELGDKTFFIAALLAARNSAAVVFVGTFGALAAMTIVSVALGRTFHYVDEILPFRFGGADLPIDDIAAVCLLAELAVSEFSGNGAGILAAANTAVSTFVLVFVAEWGDKSFFSTIALAAASSPLGVIAGALAGHGVATLLAVLGGSLLGNFLSEKAIAYVGGVLFLVFAAVTLVEIVS